MTIDLTTPETFAVSAAAFGWFVIEKIIKPVATDNWRWFQARRTASVWFWTLLMLAALLPAAWALFHDWARCCRRWRLSWGASGPMAW